MALCGAAIVAFSAQTPAPIVAVPFKAARHLEYSYHVAYQQSGEQHTGGFSAGGGGSSGSGVVSNFGGSGREGIMTADIVAMTNDNGLVVKITENVQGAARPEQTFTCAAYGDGRLNCLNLARGDQTGTTRGPSDAETLLLGFLGRDFIDASRMDAGNHWQYGYSNENATVRADFTLTGSGGGKPDLVVEHKTFEPKAQNVASAVEDVRIMYDRAMSVPVSVHDEKHETTGSSSMRTTMDLQLTKDSFATSQ